MKMARSRVVLEVARPTWREVARDRINPLRLVGFGSPAIFLRKPKKSGYGAGRNYMFTPQAFRSKVAWSP
jgi:hypothetical protein